MSISAKVILHSVSPEGYEIATVALTCHRFIAPEVGTHREISKSASSSRAIPIDRMLRMVLEDPAIPVHWGKAQKGMGALEEIAPSLHESVLADWLEARDCMVRIARRMAAKGLAKEVCNRLLEPFGWITYILTSTSWANLLSLRRHPTAQPEFQEAVGCLLTALNESRTPQLLQPGQWHLPFTTPEELAEYGLDTTRKCSAARCARASYLRHDGTTPDVTQDLGLHDRLVSAVPPHMNPAEHQATPTEDRTLWGNLKHWGSYRKTIPNEYSREFPDLLGWKPS